MCASRHAQSILAHGSTCSRLNTIPAKADFGRPPSWETCRPIAAASSSFWFCAPSGSSCSLGQQCSRERACEHDALIGCSAAAQPEQQHQQPSNQNDCAVSPNRAATCIGAGCARREPAQCNQHWQHTGNTCMRGVRTHLSLNSYRLLRKTMSRRYSQWCQVFRDSIRHSSCRNCSKRTAPHRHRCHQRASQHAALLLRSPACR